MIFIGTTALRIATSNKFTTYMGAMVWPQWSRVLVHDCPYAVSPPSIAGVDLWVYKSKQERANLSLKLKATIGEFNYSEIP